MMSPQGNKKQNVGEILDLKLFELAYGGWNKFHLRHLSTGAFTTMVFCFDSLARECAKPAKQHPELVPSSAAFLAKQLEQCAHEDRDHHIQVLEAQLANKQIGASAQG